MKKVMYALFTRSTSLVKARRTEDCSANWYTNKWVPTIVKEMNVGGIKLHHDNGHSHSAMNIIEFIDQTKNQSDWISTYSPDLDMRDIWLFFNMKQILRWRQFRSEAEIYGTSIKEYFSSIPSNECLEAFNLWKISLKKCIDLRGN